MHTEERRRQIASLTAVEGRVNVTRLAEEFGVTAETIRRDLAALDNEGMVQRVHGGAVPSSSFLTAELTMEARYRTSAAAKKAIAREALAYLPEEPGTVFLDSGTTIQMLAELFAGDEIARRHSYVTNSWPIALQLSSDQVSVQLLGGTVRALTHAIVGDTALRTLALLSADVAFIGTNALSIPSGLSTADPQEAAVKSSMVTNASRVVALCDSTKLGNNYAVSFAPLASLDAVITDTKAPDSFVADLESSGIEVVLADPALFS
ncbi:DeoR/GlpR family DNA-binding transcription regulator [Corynebacterium aquatimens]|uniref:Lactose phosphotransferase system repressor n=1 Tax=Corynebacterium aquatimens TaxID=1190508 RepID=A0A931DX84_9CORY|nr:DeoR/GlpR family DNA-binding transcription regulator [Corynebacterium aquatimens]MBG6121775.1 DeoR family fructose operon transcriptional repressor [Corynebacterium aquatimens]WJY65686.1 Lactose phosphotransferase system repressor [Corynebacterium aquatimens]